jgi:type VI secretion system protein ImpH
MAAKNGHDERDLSRIEPLDAAAIQFYELCLRLEEMFPQSGGIGATDAPARETVRFRANPTLGFPAQEVASVTLPERSGDQVVVTANLLGLHGPASPLPPAFTERIIFAEDAGALRDFSDFFNHRLLALLFRVWKHYRHHHRYAEGATDPISGAIAALFGMHGARDGDALPARVLLLPYAGMLALYSHSAPIVAGVVRHCFGVPCTIEEFVPREITIPPEDRFMLGGANGELGVGAVCGDSMRDVMGKFRIRLGPMTAAQCANLLPDGEDYKTLQDLIRLSIREPYDWDHAYVLAPGEAAAAELGRSRLGWSGWLDPDPAAQVEFVI